MNTLSAEAQKVIEKYLSLPVGATCQTPYFNNKRKRIPAGLRALVGKGKPEEIAEEAEMFSIRERGGIKKMDSETLKEFLVDHNLGVDCSGFAYHVLDAELKARGKSKMSSAVKPWSGFYRKIKHYLRPAENTGVSTFSNERNSVPIDENDVLPADFISIISPENGRNHMLVIENASKQNGVMKFTCVHSIAYSKDGVYGTGVRREELTSADLKKKFPGIITFRRLRAFAS